MHCFSVDNLEELKKFLQTRNIHDGCFHCATYDQISKRFTVRIENSVWKDSLDMVFCGIHKFVSISDYKWSEDETINCLAVMNGTGELRGYIHTNDCKDKLCFVWEMFSGNRIYIVCSELKLGDKVGDKGTVLLSPPKQTQ